MRLFRPWSAAHLLAALPPTAARVAVLDRTKENGAAAEPLFLDVLSALAAADADAAGGTPTVHRVVVGGRYGLASKEFTPTMAVAVFDNLALPSPKKRFTVCVCVGGGGTGQEGEWREGQGWGRTSLALPGPKKHFPVGDMGGGGGCRVGEGSSTWVGGASHLSMGRCYGCLWGADGYPLVGGTVHSSSPKPDTKQVSSLLLALLPIRSASSMM